MSRYPGPAPLYDYHEGNDTRRATTLANDSAKLTASTNQMAGPGSIRRKAVAAPLSESLPSRPTTEMSLGNSGHIEDVYIAIMGVTGAGKSSFIKLATGQDVRIGHTLQSCTNRVEEYSFVYSYKGQPIRLHMIDTLGFDDSNRKDTDVLRDIAAWLSNTYSDGIRLSGIMYFHPINEERMRGSAKKNLHMFRKLCGKDCFKNVLLITTMWIKVEADKGASREKELVDTEEFWGCMVKHGSTVLRHTDEFDRSSALKAINALLDRRRDLTTDLQREINLEGRKLDETSAAIVLEREILEQKAKYERDILEIREQYHEAIGEKELEFAQLLKESEDEKRRLIEDGDEARESLKMDLQQLQQQRKADIEKMQIALAETKLELETKKEEGQEYKAVYDACIREHERNTAQLRREKRSENIATVATTALGIVGITGGLVVGGLAACMASSEREAREYRQSAQRSLEATCSTPFELPSVDYWKYLN